jgi:hypothetical protein
MRDLIVLIVHLITTVLRLLRSGGVRAVVAESVLVKHQLLILNHSRWGAQNLRILDRLIAGFCSLWSKPRRFGRVAQAINIITKFSSGAGAAQVSTVVFTKTEDETGSKRSRSRFDSGGCRDETA